MYVKMIGGYIHFYLAYWSIALGFGPSRLKTLLDDWRLYLPLPRPQKVLDLLHGLKLLLPEEVPRPQSCPIERNQTSMTLGLSPSIN